MQSPVLVFPQWVPAPSLLVQLAVTGAWVGLTLLLAEGLGQFTRLNVEFTRKVLHIGVGNVILLAWWLQVPAWMGIAASVVASAVALLSHRMAILTSINAIGRKSWGTFFYAVSIGVLVALFWGQAPQYAALGILVMTWGDGLAALVGQRFGQHRYKLWDMEKSWEGSLTMALVSFGVSSLILLTLPGALWQICFVAGAIALLAASLEAFSKYGIDNLTVPLGSAALGFGLNHWFLTHLPL